MAGRGQGMPQRSHHVTDFIQEIYWVGRAKGPLRSGQERETESESERQRNRQTDRHSQRAGPAGVQPLLKGTCTALGGWW